MTLYNDACELAALGWPVFPVNGKIPLIKNWPELASTDPEQLKEWWQQFPKANIGLVTGARSDLLVLDIDGAAGRTTLENLCHNNDELPQTLAATTGRGIHYYFRFPSGSNIKNAAGKLGQGLDVRGKGGFVVAPPSQHQSGQFYQWVNPELEIEAIPNWLLDLLTPEPPPINPVSQRLPITSITENALQRYGSAALTNAMQAVASNPEGSRNYRLNMEAFNMGQLVGAGALSVAEVESNLLQSAQVCGLSTAEARSALKSGLNAGMKKPRDLSHLQSLKSQSNKAAKASTEKAKAEPTSIFQLKSISAADLMNREFKAPRWSIPNLLPEGLTILAGRPKSGKSWLAFDLCLAVATGGIALGNQQAKKGIAFYLALEDSERRLQDRLLQLNQEGEAPIDLLFTTEAPRYNEGGLQAIEEWLDHHPDCRLLVLDTLGRFRPNGRQSGDSYTEDTILLGAMQKMALEKGIALVVIHHTRKSNPESHGGDPFDAVLGSTGLTGVADSIWILSKPRNESVGQLLMTSRDVPEQKQVIEFDADKCRWSLQVEPESLCRTVERQKIFDRLSKYDMPQGPKEIALVTGLPYESVRHLMRSMEAEGMIVRKSHGKYLAHTHSQIHNRPETQS